jgi:hypothetical protein
MNRKLKNSLSSLLIVSILTGCGSDSKSTEPIIIVPQPSVTAPTLTVSNQINILVKGKEGLWIYVDGQNSHVKIGNNGTATLTLDSNDKDVGEIQFEISLVDNKGNVSQATTITLNNRPDTTAPQAVTAIAPITTNNDKTGVTIKGEKGSTIYLNGKNTHINIGDSGKETLTLNTKASNGTKLTFSITIKDLAGNLSEATIITIIKENRELTPPNITSPSTTPVPSPSTTPTPDDVIWNVSTVPEFRQALEDASTNGENDTIILAKGVYNTTSDGLGTFIFNDNEEFNLTIKSAEGLIHKDVILDGNNRNQVFNFNNTEKSTLTLKNISIINGNSTSSGGGFYSNQITMIENCNISNNISNNNGGGVSAVLPTITKSTISNNISHRSGGGIYGFKIAGTNDFVKITIRDSNITDNSSKGAGGGLQIGSKESLFSNLIISNNSASTCAGFSSWGKIIIKDSKISNNVASMDYKTVGGGFCSNKNTIIINSILSENKAMDQTNVSNGFHSKGGAFYTSGDMIIVNSIFLNNIATKGGGCYMRGNINAHITPDTLYLVNNYFSGNQNNIEVEDRILVINNILNSNIEHIILGRDSKFYNNYVNSNIIDGGISNIIKKNNLQPSLVGDIYLSDDNKTLTEDSPVIDKGLNPSSATYKKIIDNDAIYNQLLELLKTDMVGHKRVHNGTIDMGAVEYGSSR